MTCAVDQTAEQLLGDRVLPAWLDIIFLHLAPSHTCNRVVVHMNAHSSTGIEPCFRSHCSVINNRSQQIYTTSLLAWEDMGCHLDFTEGIACFGGIEGWVEKFTVIFKCFRRSVLLLFIRLWIHYWNNWTGGLLHRLSWHFREMVLRYLCFSITLIFPLLRPSWSSFSKNQNPHQQSNTTDNKLKCETMNVIIYVNYRCVIISNR